MNQIIALPSVTTGINSLSVSAITDTTLYNITLTLYPGMKILLLPQKKEAWFEFIFTLT